MPSRPPETEFYNDTANKTLWRDISRLFEDFCGSDEAVWRSKQEAFQSVLADVQERLEGSSR